MAASALTADLQNTVRLVLLKLYNCPYSLAIGTLDEAQAHHAEIDVLAYGARERIKQFVTDCRQYMPDTADQMAAAAYVETPTALDEVRRQCHQRMASLEFVCR